METKQDKARLQLGKGGVTDSLVAEICAQLKKKKVLKVRILKSALKDKNRRDIAAEVAARCRAELEDIRGHTFTLRKKSNTAP